MVKSTFVDGSFSTPLRKTSERPQLRLSDAIIAIFRTLVETNDS